MNAEEIRKQIIETVAKNGGHLASSLGAVELSMALASAFDPEKDRIVWDVGHQAYAWKILTGRADTFGTLRRFGGISPFPNPAESVCDAAVAGHAGVALSTALGLASARDRRGSSEHVVAVVGDGAIVNGTSLEALNNLASVTKRFIVVLNDNDMSISRPVGSFASYLGRIHSGARYNRAKMFAKKAGRALGLSGAYGLVHWVKNRIKTLLLRNVWLERFGLHYLGPVNGHDLDALKSAFEVAKAEERPVFIHVITKKGMGFEPAEKDPTRWHGVGPFDLDDPTASDCPVSAEKPVSWSEHFGEALCRFARRDERIVALSAGMKDGTGLRGFAAEFPRRFVDVGIAEGHMVAFAAGLAAGGFRPVVAVYSTFLLRAVDQIMHDVCISKLPVVFCVDRAGVVGADGSTHHGVFDIAMLRPLPNLVIAQPADATELAELLEEAFHRDGPTVIRYPRGCRSIADRVRSVAGRLGCEYAHAKYLKPVDETFLRGVRAAGKTLVTIEDGSLAGGFGEAAGADLRFGWPDRFIPHGTVAELERSCGLDEDSLVESIRNYIKERGISESSVVIYG